MDEVRKTSRQAASDAVLRRPARMSVWIVVLIVMGLCAGLGVVVAVGVNVDPVRSQASTLAQHTIPAQEALSSTVSASAASQEAFLDALTSTDPTARGDALDRAQKAGAEQDAAWSTFERVALGTSAQRGLQAEYNALYKQTRVAGAEAYGLSPGDPAALAAVEAERSLWAQKQAVLVRLQEQFSGPAVRAAAQGVVDEMDSNRSGILLAWVGAMVTYLGVGIVLLRRSMRFDRRSAREAREHTIERRRAEAEAQLQRGLEMESSEEGASAVVRQALETLVPGQPVELLVADSSRAHFRQAVSTTDDGRGSCQVGSPGECPVANGGQSRFFGDSRDIDTCPYLRGKPDPVWASCVPVSIAGRSTGVLHAEGPVDEPADDELADELELVARRAGERIGVLRVLARARPRLSSTPSRASRTDGRWSGGHMTSSRRTCRSSSPTPTSTTSRI